jgi:hypothetical protein
VTPKQLLAALSRRTVPGLIRTACVLALIGLGIMLLPMLLPGALSVVLSMAVGHVVGLSAGALYLIAILLDVARRRDE